MLAVLCLLAILGLGQCLDYMPTREEIEASINRTIEEVERKVQADPSLPRLSRKDIVDILQNITTKDLTSVYNKTRNEYQRALMVVLPYNSNGAEENLKDLYTKPPMVQMISDDNGSRGNGEEEFEYPSDEPYQFKEQTSDNLIPTFPTANSVDGSSTAKDHHKDNKEESGSRFDTKPLRFSFDLEKLGTAPTTTQRPLHTWRPVKKVTDSPHNDMASSVADVAEEATSSTTEKPSSKSIQHVLTSNQWRYHPPPPTTPRPRYRLPQKGFFLPTIESASVMEDNQKKDQKSEDTKQGFNTLKFEQSEAMTLPTEQTERPLPVYVTPMSESKTKDSYTLAASGFISATTPPTMRPEVEDLLESIGLRPMTKTDDAAHDLTLDKKLTEAKFQIPDTNDVVHKQTSGLTTSGVESASIVDQNTFDNPDVKIQKGVDNLTPAIQLLFKKFGLQTSLNGDFPTTTTTVRSTTAHYNSYTNFKPLPNSPVRDKDMRDFLAKFGLGVGETRNQKAIRPKKDAREEAHSLIEAVPGNMRNILENIGLITKRQERGQAGLKREVNSFTTTTPKLHVFKPQESSVFNNQQRSKIRELLDTVRKVQQGKADIEEVQKVADEVLETTKTLPKGPDPASLEEILKLYKEDLKNEVKRQQATEDYEKEIGGGKNLNEKDDAKEAMKEDDKNETEGRDQKSPFSPVASGDLVTASQELVPASVTISTEAPKATTKKSFFDSFDLDAAIKGAKESTTESSSSETTSSPNLTALEESFGGSTAKPDPVLPTRKRTGLYFLVDWNTFLEVGEDGKDKVNLRFQPRVGDRTRFLKVTVP